MPSAIHQCSLESFPTRITPRKKPYPQADTRYHKVDPQRVSIGFKSKLLQFWMIWDGFFTAPYDGAMATLCFPSMAPDCSQLLRQVGAVNRFLHHLQQPAILWPHDLLAEDRLGLGPMGPRLGRPWVKFTRIHQIFPDEIHMFPWFFHDFSMIFPYVIGLL